MTRCNVVADLRKIRVRRFCRRKAGVRKREDPARVRQRPDDDARAVGYGDGEGVQAATEQHDAGTTASPAVSRMRHAFPPGRPVGSCESHASKQACIIGSARRVVHRNQFRADAMLQRWAECAQHDGQPATRAHANQFSCACASAGARGDCCSFCQQALKPDVSSTGAYAAKDYQCP